MPKFQSGPNHHNWKGGKSVNKDGYIRLWTGKYKRWYEHRAVTMRLLEEEGAWCWWERNEKGFPMVSVDKGIGFDVHHMDGNRIHNCPGNLLLLDERIHIAISSHREYRGRFTGRVPDWVEGDSYRWGEGWDDPDR